MHVHLALHAILEIVYHFLFLAHFSFIDKGISLGNKTAHLCTGADSVALKLKRYQRFYRYASENVILLCNFFESSILQLYTVDEGFKRMADVLIGDSPMMKSSIEIGKEP